MDERVLHNFMTPEGRLHTIPSRHQKLLVVLDHIAQSFEPGKTYPEADVNAVLSGFHPDYAALRRYLACYVSAIPLGFGFLVAALRRDKRALHDLIAGSRVERLPPRRSSPQA